MVETPRTPEEEVEYQAGYRDGYAAAIESIGSAWHDLRPSVGCREDVVTDAAKIRLEGVGIEAFKLPVGSIWYADCPLCEGAGCGLCGGPERQVRFTRQRGDVRVARVRSEEEMVRIASVRHILNNSIFADTEDEEFENE